MPESKEAPATVSLSSSPREPGGGASRFNYAKLKRHHPKYKRQRTGFAGGVAGVGEAAVGGGAGRPTSTDSRGQYDRYKEEDNENTGAGGFGCENDKEVRHLFIYYYYLWNERLVRRLLIPRPLVGGLCARSLASLYYLFWAILTDKLIL